MHNRNILSTICLLLWTGLLSTAPRADWFHDSLQTHLWISNRTPFSLKVTESGLLFTRVGSGSQFTFSEAFVAQDYRLAPGSITLIGYGASQDEELNGYLVLAIGDTDKSFELYYQFSTDVCFEVPAVLVTSHKGGSFQMADSQISGVPGSCRQQERFAWFVPIDAWDYRSSGVVYLTTSDEDIACIEDSACRSDCDRYAQGTSQEGVQGCPEESPAPDSIVEQVITLVNKTPFTLKLTGYTTEQDGDTPLVFSGITVDKNFRSGRLRPGGTAPLAITMQARGALDKSCVQGDLTFEVENTQEAFHVHYDLLGESLCFPEFEPISTRTRQRYTAVLMRYDSGCYYSRHLGTQWVPGMDAFQRVLVTFDMDEPAEACMHQGGCTEEALQEARRRMRTASATATDDPLPSEAENQQGRP